MNPVVTLLKPKALAFRNGILKSTTAAQRGQSIAIAGFSLIVMATLFFATRWGLEQLTKIPLLVYVPPSLPLSLMLMMLLVMTSLTALASALGSFYLADDVETILASPTSSLSFFVARLIYVLCTVAWMPFIFISPVLAAMATSYQLSAWFVPLSIATFIPYFLIPAAIGTLVATIFMATINQRWAKMVVRVAILMAIACVLYVLHGLVDAVTIRSTEGQMLRLASSLSLAQSSWLPSAWAATILSENLVPSGRSIAGRLTLLYSCAIAVTGLAHIALHTLHPRGFSKALSRRAEVSRTSREGTARGKTTLPQPAAVIQKDLRSLTRDVAQSTQIIFLSALCLFYLGNLRTFVALDSFATDASVNWQRAFFIIHTAITAFFTSSICTRLVFTSISLEGKSYWILQTAPVLFRDVLRAKFLGWYIPIAVLSSLLFSIGTQILIGRWDITLLFGLLSFYVSYGIVGMGIGLGAYFADFSWEHPSQLALSVGSLVYMLSSATLVLLNILPMGILLHLLLSGKADLPRVTLICAVSIAIAFINLFIAKMAMRLGERSSASVE